MITTMSIMQNNTTIKPLKKTNMQKIYISGKITGMVDEARILFDKAEVKLKEMGFHPINPMNLPDNHDKKWTSYLKVCIKAMCDCDSIYMLENWRMSKGAGLEYFLAKKLNMDIIYESQK